MTRGRTGDRSATACASRSQDTGLLRRRDEGLARAFGAGAPLEGGIAGAPGRVKLRAALDAQRPMPREQLGRVGRVTDQTACGADPAGKNCHGLLPRSDCHAPQRGSGREVAARDGRGGRSGKKAMRHPQMWSWPLKAYLFSPGLHLQFNKENSAVRLGCGLLWHGEKEGKWSAGQQDEDVCSTRSTEGCSKEAVRS